MKTIESEEKVCVGEKGWRIKIGVNKLSGSKVDVVKNGSRGRENWILRGLPGL